MINILSIIKAFIPRLKKTLPE